MTLKGSDAEQTLKWFEARVLDRSNWFDKRYANATKEELRRGYHYDRCVPATPEPAPITDPTPDDDPKSMVELTIVTSGEVERN